MKQKLILASRNKGKIRECAFLLRESAFDVVGLDEAGMEGDIEETGSTLQENAAIKAESIFLVTGDAVLAEDSGLFVEALDGAPGVYSARYAGTHGDDEANNALLLQNMRGIDNRKARFEACLCYVDKTGKKYFFTGVLNGKLTTEARGTSGFGYDPIFIADGYDITNAQMEAEQKNAISHRAEAIEKWLNFMRDNC